MPVDTADLVIRNALLLDGSGAPGVTGDLAVCDDRIVALGDLTQLRGRREIEAGGLALAPGFIDTHTHDDRALLSDPLMGCKASQGVTTVVTGNCGISLAPLVTDRRPPPPLDLVAEEPRQFFASVAEYLAALDRDPPALNAACQIGHSVLRVGAMARLDRPADAAETERMRAALDQGLDDGAIGLSTGLFYAPAAAATAAEIITLAAPLARYGGILTSHLRDEADHILPALDEAFAIAGTVGARLVLSHHKIGGRQNHGRSIESLARIDAARRTQPVGFDVYPYAASSTVLEARRALSADKVLVTWSRQRPEAAGRELAEIAAEMGCGLAEAVEKLQPAGAIYFMMDEADVRRVLSHPHAMIGSDGLPHDEHPHPRLWGTFPRVLGHYARDIGLFPLAEAVRRMTSLPATVFGLSDRGVLRPGAYADLVLFDPATVADRATYTEPRLPASGISLVMVNGCAVWAEGASTGNRPGRVLRRAQSDQTA